MKKLVTVFLLLPSLCFAQNNSTEPCGFDEYISRHKRIADEFEKQVHNFLLYETSSGQRDVMSGNVKIIPVVVHIIHNNGTENISDAQVLSQIDVLNEDYLKIPLTNGDGNGVDVEVQFCLAKISPDGRCTNGIVRVQSTLTNLQSVQDAPMKALSHWDPTRYFNIYVVKTIGGSVLGYASYPGGPPNEDGMVCVHNYFGRTGTASASLGRTTTHEVGHWFGLYHTFHDSCGTDTCTDGDHVCDTPPVANPNFGCPIINSCSNDMPDVNDQIENYMDYTNDACKNMFTAGQKARAQATLNTVRTNIWQFSNVWSTGCDSSYVSPPCPAVADFTSNGQTICVGNSVLFTNRSLNNCTSYQWYFPGGTPSSSTSVNQTVTYSTVGIYNVSLVATNINGTDSVTFVNYITVITPLVGQPLQFTEGFETTVFPPNGITISNPDAGITWERDTVAAQYGGFGSAKINNLINTNYGQADAMIIPNLDLTSFASPYISFRWAYARSDPNYSDELSVQISTDCGVNFTQIFYRTGAAMATGPTQTTPYIPDTSTVWKLCNVSLASYASSDHAIIKIVNVTDGGNNLYIDNINIGASATVGVEEIGLSEGNVQVFPNPSCNSIKIIFPNVTNAQIKIINALGEIKLQETFSSNNQNEIDISELAGGIYFLMICSDNKILSQKFIKN